jgi:hypothetical protein
MIDAAPLMPRFGDDEALAMHLLEHGVAVVAASAFGGGHCDFQGFRISFAADEAKLAEAFARIARRSHDAPCSLRRWRGAGDRQARRPAAGPPRAGGVSLENHLGLLRLGFQRPPAPVHRLDRDTSGCLLLARNPKALKRFALAFEQRQVDKRYLGIVAGPVAGDQG